MSWGEQAGSKSQLCHFFTVQFGANYLTSLCLHWLLWKLRLMIILPSQGVVRIKLDNVQGRARQCQACVFRSPSTSCPSNEPGDLGRATQLLLAFDFCI